MSEKPMSGRRKSRAMNTGPSNRSMPTSPASSTRSFASGTSDYPAGRKPRGSVVAEGDFPEGRKPRGSVFVEEEIIVEEKIINDSDEFEEEEAKKRRKRLACIIACVLILILVIVIIAILLSVLGTGDAATNGSIGGAPSNCVVNNETKPTTYEEFTCEVLTTLTTRDSTYLRTYSTTSPYGMAIGWMTKEDKTDFLNTPTEHVVERFIMVLFYFMTGGKDWFTRFEFLTQQHLCDWTGDSKNAIRCAYAQDKKVTDLGMPQNGLTGPIPTELGYLTELTRVYFSINSLSGNIPSELFQLTKLEKLYLDRNDLKGKIPTQINQLTGLTTLYLSNNDFNGDLTEICDIANTTFTNNGTKFDFHSDCDTGRVTCECCKTCV